MLTEFADLGNQICNFDTVRLPGNRFPGWVCVS
jgi:hypothetical protein